MYELVEKFLEARRTELSKESRRVYHVKLSHFLKELKKRGMEPKLLTKTAVVQYISLCFDKKQKADTIQNKLAILKSFAKWLWEMDRLSEKEYKLIKSYHPKVVKGEDNRRALTPKDETLCLQKISNPMQRMMFFVGISYGLRTQEYANLKVSDINLKEKYLVIRASKGKKTRKIPILPKHIEEWESWLMVREAYKVNHEYVFFTSNGKCTPMSVYRFFQLMSKTVYGYGLDEAKWFTPHTLRYTYATKLWRGDVNIVLISKMLGHSRIETTQRYLRIPEKELMQRYQIEASRAL